MSIREKRNLPPKPEHSAAMTRTLNHYTRTADGFKEGTWDHDVTQNYQALLEAIEGDAPYSILDLGCGPGRDLVYFQSLGHTPIGLDGSPAFVEMAHAETGCEVLHQDFLSLDLKGERFDGIFANATLFHVPSLELPRVLKELHASLKPGGVLFSSIPRLMNTDVKMDEGFVNERFCCYHSWESWQRYCLDAGFEELHHYYRPDGKPRNEQPWLASVWRKT